MPGPRKTRILHIYAGQTLVGTYGRQASGATSFAYDPTWLASPNAFPVSLSLPLTDRRYGADKVDAVFDGMLPDNPVVKEKIAARMQAEGTGTFDLLAAIGRDCVGALRFIPDGVAPGNPNDMASQALSNDDIEHQLTALATTPLGQAVMENDNDNDFRLSLAGMQDKTAFLRREDGWHRPLGATPTSHIFKPDMGTIPNGPDFTNSPWNEWFCLKFCKAMGLPTANADIYIFGGKPVLVVERFDRLWRDGILYRLPQEDMCQALGVGPERKYEADGGPGILDVMKLLNAAADPYQDRRRFFMAQIVFWLLAAVDGHAKNFSIAHSPSGFHLTELYDVLSADPYPELSPEKVKLAMAIGDNRHYRVRDIAVHHFVQTGQKTGLPKQDIDFIIENTEMAIEPALLRVMAETQFADMPPDLFDAISSGIRQRARMFDHYRTSQRPTTP